MLISYRLNGTLRFPDNLDGVSNLERSGIADCELVHVTLVSEVQPLCRILVSVAKPT